MDVTTTLPRQLAAGILWTVDRLGFAELARSPVETTSHGGTTGHGRPHKPSNSGGSGTEQNAYGLPSSDDTIGEETVLASLPETAPSQESGLPQCGQ